MADEPIDHTAATASPGVEMAERQAPSHTPHASLASEREPHAEHDIRHVLARDDTFPHRLRDHLGDACPAFLHVGGPVAFLHLPVIGVVGSRNAPPDALAVAAAAAQLAAANQLAVVSGLARGIDRAAMTAALAAGAPTIGVPSEGIGVVTRHAEVRRRMQAGELCIASPYAPDERFTVGNAMARNKIIYALADITLVVCADAGSGGTWHGARDALRRHFGRVAVWTGPGAGPGNTTLIEHGGIAIADLGQLLELGHPGPSRAAPTQPSLFD